MHNNAHQNFACLFIDTQVLSFKNTFLSYRNLKIENKQLSVSLMLKLNKTNHTKLIQNYFCKKTFIFRCYNF